MDAYLNEVVRYLLGQSWQIAVLVAGVAAVTFVLRNRSAHVRYLLWMIVLAKCLVPPLYAVPLRLLPASLPDGIGPVLSWTQGSEDPVTVVNPTAQDAPRPSQESAPASLAPQTGAPRLSASGWLAVLWIAGAGVYLMLNLLRAVRGQYWLRRTRRPLPEEVRVDSENLLRTYGVRRLPRVWIMEGIGQPFVWGLWRGSIYVPPAFLAIESPQHRRDILAHELSHVLRFDAAVNTLQVIAQALFWFHPFVWWANQKIRREREKCCDEMAIAHLGAGPKDYSTALVSTLIQAQESARPVPSLAVAGPAKNIEERIRTMLKPGREFYKHPSIVSATIVLLLAVLAVPSTLVLTTRAQDRPSVEKDDTAAASMTPAEEEALKQLKEALARGREVDTRDSWEHTILHRVCMENYTKVAEFFIDKGADVNAGNITGITPLHTAAGRGHADMVKLLLDKKADVNARDDHGATPLWYAKNGVVYSFEVFGRFSKGVTARWNAENPGCKKAVELLVERGAEEHAPVISLHEAAHAGLIEKVKSLVAEGADVNAMDDRLAATALHLAAYNNQTEVVEFLVAHGADVNARNKWDRTPLHIAIDQRRTEIAELLRQHGATLEPSPETTRMKAPTSLFKSATSKSAIPERCMEIPEQMQTCATNLRKIHAAIKKYEEDKGQLPAWLSDLVPNYVRKEMLMCPAHPETRVPWPVDPKLPCGYAYEFSPFRAYARFGGAPTDGMTQRDRKMAQVAFFGDVVPLCRCRLHGDPHGPMNLNLSVGGEVYLSGPQWESTIMPDYKVGSELSETPLR